MDESLLRSRGFYAVVLTSMAVGITLDLANFSPMKALYWSAVTNGVLAPFLLLGIIIVARDRKLMQEQPSSGLSLIVVGATTLLMFGAAIAMFAF